jgi:hypothetical protein
MNIPIKIYSYAIIISILIILAISGYLYVLPNIGAFEKTFIIWFTIILELNLAHLYYILNFYDANLNKKGPVGPKGEVGPRGFKGNSEKCSSCDGAGQTITKYGGIINDKGELDPDAKRGKCQYPFVHNYQYQYGNDGCIKSDPPPGQTDNNANIHGWCATEIDEKNNVDKYGYCNENESIQDKMAKEKAYSDARNNYLNSNYGILDIDVVDGNTETEAVEKCDTKGSNYSVLKNKDGGNQDLNEGIGGKFLYLCSETGFGSLGVSSIKVKDSGVDGKPNTEIKDDDNLSYKIVESKIDLNKDSPSHEIPLYMYKHTTNEDFIKELKILDKGSKETCEKALGKDWYKIHTNLNDVNGTTADTDTNKVHSLKLCANKKAVVNNIDNAFNYKGKLYIFRGDKFYKMTKEPIQSVIKSEEDYPKHISERWFSGDDCSAELGGEDACNSHIKCRWNSKARDPNSDPTGDSPPPTKGLCESIIYNSAFTYGHDNKTYFFNGGNVSKYNDKQMKIEDGFPKPINEIFKGIPANIDAVFTWPKDGKTYFFKGEQFYKYNDKKQEIESGYPRPTKNRWKGFPDQINAIFTLDISLDSNNDTHPTYVIDGNGQSYYIDPVTDELKQENKKPIDERFKMFDIDNENENSVTTSVGTTTTAN